MFARSAGFFRFPGQFGPARSHDFSCRTSPTSPDFFVNFSNSLSRSFSLCGFNFGGGRKGFRKFFFWSLRRRIAGRLLFLTLILKSLLRPRRRLADLLRLRPLRRLADFRRLRPLRRLADLLRLRPLRRLADFLRLRPLRRLEDFLRLRPLLRRLEDFLRLRPLLRRLEDFLRL